MSDTIINTTLFKSETTVTKTLYQRILDGIPAYEFFKNGGINAQKGQKRLSETELQQWNNQLAFDNITSHAIEAEKTADTFDSDILQITESPAFESFCTYQATQSIDPTIRTAWQQGDFRTALTFTQSEQNFKDIYQGCRHDIMERYVEPALLRLSRIENTYRSLIEAVNNYNNTHPENALVIDQHGYSNNLNKTNNITHADNNPLLNFLKTISKQDEEQNQTNDIVHLHNKQGQK